MRQLDLFGFDSEPQPVAPSQKKKAVTVVPVPEPVTTSAPDSNTLVFADDKIGIKIKLKHAVSAVADTTPSAPVPKMGDVGPDLENENAAGLLQQLTLEDAIREVHDEENNLAEDVATEPVVNEAAVATGVLVDGDALVAAETVSDAADEVWVDEGNVDEASVEEAVIGAGEDALVADEVVNADEVAVEEGAVVAEAETLPVPEDADISGTDEMPDEEAVVAEVEEIAVDHPDAADNTAIEKEAAAAGIADAETGIPAEAVPDEHISLDSTNLPVEVNAVAEEVAGAEDNAAAVAIGSENAAVAVLTVPPADIDEAVVAAGEFTIAQEPVVAEEMVSNTEDILTTAAVHNGAVATEDAPEQVLAEVIAEDAPVVAEPVGDDNTVLSEEAAVNEMAEVASVSEPVMPAVVAAEEAGSRTEEVKPVVLSRPFLAKPAIIEISNDAEDIPVAEPVTPPVVEEVPVAAPALNHAAEEVAVDSQDPEDSIVEASAVVTPGLGDTVVEEVPVTAQEDVHAVVEETPEVTTEPGNEVTAEQEIAVETEDVFAGEKIADAAEKVVVNEENIAAQDNEVAADAAVLAEATLPPSAALAATAAPKAEEDKGAEVVAGTSPVDEAGKAERTVQEVPVVAANASPLVAKVAEMPAAESLSAIVEEVAARQQQPAKIKAPKLQASKEPVAPKKRGRKSFKEIDAESDLIQLPDDEALFEKQYYPISVVAGWFNVNASLLRFWENEFDILKPRKNRKGDRLFRPEDVKNLQVIYYLLRQRKFTIEGAKEYLKTNKKKADTNTQLIQSLNKLRGFLLEFKANIHA